MKIRASIGIIILLALLTGCAETPESVKEKIGKLTQKRDEIEKEIYEKYVEFGIHGKIIDRGEDRILVYGDSWPTHMLTNPQVKNHLGVVRQGSIIVLNPNLKMPDFYSSSNSHYFVKKTTAKNAFGAEMPVRVFTTAIPKEKKTLKEKYDKIDKELNKLANTLYKMDQKTFNQLFPPAEPVNQPQTPAESPAQAPEQQSSNQPAPATEPDSSMEFNEELLGVKYVMTVENGILSCHVNDFWNSLSIVEKHSFLKQIGQKKYFGKSRFIVKNPKGADLAEYNHGQLRLF